MRSTLLVCILLLGLALPVLCDEWRGPLKERAHHNAFDDEDDDEECIAWTRTFDEAWSWAPSHFTITTDDDDFGTISGALLASTVDGSVKLVIVDSTGDVRAEKELPLTATPVGIKDVIPPSMAIKHHLVVVCGASHNIGTSKCVLYYLSNDRITSEVSFASPYISGVTQGDDDDFLVIAGNTAYRIEHDGDGDENPELRITNSRQLGLSHLGWDMFENFWSIGFAVARNQTNDRWHGLAINVEHLIDDEDDDEHMVLWDVPLSGRYAFAQYNDDTVMAVNPDTPNCIDFYDMDDGERLERSCLGSDARIGGLVGWSDQDMVFVNTHDSVVGLSDSDGGKLQWRKHTQETELYRSVPMALKRDAYQFDEILFQAANSTVVGYSPSNGGALWSYSLPETVRPVMLWGGKKSVITLTEDDKLVPQMFQICTELASKNEAP